MNKINKILLVEDEETLAIGLEFNLSAEGYAVTWVKDGKQALEKFAEEKFDLIVLDVMLPYFNGFEVAEKIRLKNMQIPILFLTARTGLKDRLKGLELGADDYLTKPFHLEELLLRVKGMFKRKEWYKDSLASMPVFHFGKNEINFENLTCRTGNETIHLTAHEAMLLKHLIENEGKIVSRKEILQKVWNINEEVETRTVDNFIARLRKYFEQDSNNPVFFKSVRSVGYIFNRK